MGDQQPERRPRGRPSLGPGGESDRVNVRMSPATYTAAHARAGVERRSVPDLVRRAVGRYLAEPDEPED